MAGLLYTSKPDLPNQVPSSVPPSLLTPENCESSSRIRAFLRLSRFATDDSIIQHLNDLNHPSQCDNYFAQNILPQWRARSDAIQYCSTYAQNLRKEVKLKENTLGEDYDLRTDPYALKDAQEALDNHYSRCVDVENWVANETNVEAIIRDQTSKMLSDKCYYKDWLQDFRNVTKNYEK